MYVTVTCCFVEFQLGEIVHQLSIGLKLNVHLAFYQNYLPEKEPLAQFATAKHTNRQCNTIMAYEMVPNVSILHKATFLA